MACCRRDRRGSPVLYRVNAAGQATQYQYQPPHPNEIIGVVGGFTSSQASGEFAFSTSGETNAFCYATLSWALDTATGAIISPKTPATGGGPNPGPTGWLVEGTWVDRTGTPYASLAPSPSDCATNTTLKSSGVTPIVCKLSGGSWVPTGRGVFQAAYGPGNWLAEDAGVTTQSNIAPATMAISDGTGTTPVTVPNVDSFAWAPSASSGEPSGAVPSGNPAGTQASATPGSAIPSATPTASGSSGLAIGPCPTSGLQLAVNWGAGQVVMERFYVPLEFTNISGRACTLYGYPGVAMTTGTTPASQVGSEASRYTSGQAVGTTDVPATLITLAPDATASATLEIVNVSVYDSSACLDPVSVSYLQVTRQARPAPPTCRTRGTRAKPVPSPLTSWGSQRSRPAPLAKALAAAWLWAAAVPA